MAFKPFKPPGPKSNQSSGFITSLRSPEPAPKRIKLSTETSTDPTTRTYIGINHESRKPLQVIPNPPSPELDVSEEGSCVSYYAVMWRKFTLKKNKTWDDDGVVSFQNGQLTLYDSKGRQLGSGTHRSGVYTGSTISTCGREVLFESEISKDDFNAVVKKQVKGHNIVINPAQISKSDTDNGTIVTKAPRQMTLQEQMKAQIKKEKVPQEAVKKHSLPSSVSARGSAFKQPLKDNTVLAQIPSEVPIPRHDPLATGALVFQRPKRVPIGKQIVDVVLDPSLTRHLRDHQREGIKFLYECVMDARDFSGQGCILADDMGLGKTLQTIALLWTLIKQNPIYKAEPVVKKALIVCPVTLVENWKKEFRKWLGRDKLGVMAWGDKGSRLSMFDGKNFKIMIVGYERLRTIAEDLNRGSGIDIIVCDEGHRLKTLQNKSAKAMETLNTPRRIILSGTPIQNDLSEFFAMANFVNDGVLGTYKAFVKDFENPIIKSRQPDATENDIERGEHASNDLASLTSPFILRRTADILSKYLPPKTEYVLFCQPTAEQANIYKNILKTPMFHNASGGNETALQLITILKKLCNSPSLMRPLQGNDEATSSSSLHILNEMLPSNLSRLFQNSFSSKIRLLDELLQQIRTTTDDKVVLVSNYTTTLNLMESLLQSSGMTYRRLDGAVPPSKRQPMVDEFNRASPSTCFAFLLSAKAGGIGLNLIGGNRLILFDVDWNPATDDQAMARIHREGQKKPCKIYRFLIKGGLEERIWQRQVVKRGLADSIMDNRSNSRSTNDAPTSKSKQAKAAFSREELRDLFRLDERQSLQTHDLMKCHCGETGEVFSDDHESTSALVEEAKPVYDIDSISDMEDKDKMLKAPVPNTFVKASTLTDESLDLYEEDVATKKHGRRLGAKRRKCGSDNAIDDTQDMHELMTYTHIDTSNISTLDDTNDRTLDELAKMEDLIDDDCLMHVLKLDRDVVAGNISFVFKKKSMVSEVLDPSAAPEAILAVTN